MRGPGQGMQRLQLGDRLVGGHPPGQVGRRPQRQLGTPTVDLARLGPSEPHRLLGVGQPRHGLLVVDDPERTLAWYGHHAGLAGVRVDEWRAGTAPFPSLRVDEATIIDLIPGLDDPGPRGHLDHICFVVTREGLDALAADPPGEFTNCLYKAQAFVVANRATNFNNMNIAAASRVSNSILDGIS